MNDRNRGFFYPGAAALGMGTMLACQLAAADTYPHYDHTIYALEHALIGVGYELKPVDGLMDPTTHSALMDYQKKRGFSETSGSITDEALVALGVKAAQAPAPQTAGKEAAMAVIGVSARPNETIRIKPIDTDKPIVKTEEDGGWLFF